MLPVKLSVAMCTYNGALYLSEQLESLAEQIRPPDELVICDDCSSDATVEIIRAFSASRAPFPVRLYVNENNLGVAKNFERAAELCAGELIAFADHDDVWDAEKLQLIEREFDRAPEVGVVFSDAEIVDSQLEPTGHTMWEYAFTEEHRRMVRAGHAFEILLAGCTVTGATMAFRSKYRELALPFPPDELMVYDGWMALMIATVAEIGFINRTLIKYRQHERQHLGSHAPEKFNLVKCVRRARRTRAGGCYLPLLDKFEAVLARLYRHRDQLLRPEIVPLMEEWIAHLSLRAELPDAMLRRTPLVCRELLTRRYHRFSRGLTSALKDVCF